MGKILVIDFCNYEDYQIGGHLSMAKNLLSAFGNDLTLVGITTDKVDPTGRWFKKKINGVDYDFFALARYDKSKTKHLIPDRLVSYFLLKLFKKKILSKGLNNVFIQRHEIIIAVKSFGFKNICFCFPGLESPLGISKYWYSRYLAKKFDRAFFSELRKVHLILASGDDKAIQEMIERSNNLIPENSVLKFPTRINTDVFKPLDQKESRSKMNIPEEVTVVCTTGRLAWLKGWKFMVDCFIMFEKSIPGSLFYMIGTGEDLQKIQEYIAQKNITDKVILPGGKKLEEISLFLNASDLYIMGSYKEGWSTALSEAIACGVPACVTHFSSAEDIIREGENGYVIREHDEKLFVQGMLKALKITRPVYNDNVVKYSSDNLKQDLLNIWKLI